MEEKAGDALMPFTQEEIDSAPTINEWRQDPDFKKMAPAEQRQFIQRYGMEVERKRTTNRNKSPEAKSMQAQAIMHGGAVPDRTVTAEQAHIPGKYGNALADMYNNSLMGKISQTVNHGEPVLQSQTPKSFGGKVVSQLGSLVLDTPAYVLAGGLSVPAKALGAVAKLGKAAPVIRGAIEGAKTFGTVGLARDALTPPAHGEEKTISKTLKAGGRDALMGAATLGAGQMASGAAANAVAKVANKGAINLLGRQATAAERLAEPVARNMAETGVQSIDEVMRNGLPVDDNGEVDYGALGSNFAKNILLSGIVEGTQGAKRAAFDRRSKGKPGEGPSARTSEGDALIDGMNMQPKQAQRQQPQSNAINWNEQPEVRPWAEQNARNAGMDMAGPDFFASNPETVGQTQRPQRTAPEPEAIEPSAIYSNEADMRAALMAERNLPPGPTEGRPQLPGATGLLPEGSNAIPMGPASYHPEVMTDLAGRMDAAQAKITRLDQALANRKVSKTNRAKYQAERARLTNEWNGMFSVFRSASKANGGTTAEAPKQQSPDDPAISIPTQPTNAEGRPINPTSGQAGGPTQLHAGINPFNTEAGERAAYEAAGGVTPYGESIPGKKAAGAVKAWLQSNDHHPIVNSILNGLVQDWNMPTAHRDNKAAAEQAAEAVRHFAVDMDAELYKFNPAEREAITSILEGDAPADPRFADVVDPIRAKIEVISDQLVQYGVLPEGSRERFRDKWLHRSYMDHEAPGSGTLKFMGRMFSDTKKFASGMLKGRGKGLTISWERAQRLLQSQHVDTRNGNQVYQLKDGHEYELQHLGGNKFRLWRDWTPKERGEMGQIMDARYNVLKSLDQMAQNVETGKLFHDTAQDPNLAIKAGEGVEQPEGWKHLSDKKIPGTGTPTYGALAGHYVHPGVARDIEAVVSMNTPGVWKKVMGTWKMNKTARSPRTHIYNIGGNIVASELHGVKLHSDGVEAVAGLVGRGDAATKQFLKEAQDNGVFGRTNLDGLQRALLQPSHVTGDVAPNANIKQRGHAAINQLMHSMALGKDRPIEAIKGVVNMVKWLDSEAIRAYQGEDHVFRFALYLNRRKQGMAPAQAAKEAIAGYVDTSNVNAPWINAASQVTHPFIKWPYKAFPMMAEAIANRPLKAAKIAGLMYGLNQLSSKIAGGDEDAERKAMDGVMHGAHLRLPFKDKYGQQMYFDGTKFIPGNQFTDLNTKGAIPLPGALAPGGPAVTAAELLTSNRQGFNGKDIRDNRKPWHRQVGEVASYAAQSYLPDIPGLPGTYSTDKINAAIDGRPDSGGRLNSVPSAMLSSIGIKTNPVDVRQLAEKRVGQAKGKISGYQRVISEYKRLVQRQQMTMDQARPRIQEQADLINAEKQDLKSYLEKVRQPLELATQEAQ